MLLKKELRLYFFLFYCRCHWNR